MLCAIFPRLAQQRAVAAIASFYRSGVYPALIVLVMVVSELFSLELAALWLYLLSGIVSVIILNDSIGVLPVAVCTYMTISRPNSTVHFLGETIFDDPACRIQLGVMAAVAVAVLAVHAIMASCRQKRTPPVLFSGFITLGAAYLLSGVFTSHYGLATVVFGGVQFISLALFYVYFYATLDRETFRKEYIPTLLCLVGAGVAVQVVGMYAAPTAYGESGIIREQLFTGWGTYNNVACILAMCLPAPFYFIAGRGKTGWFALAVVFFCAIVLTQSRAGIAFGAVVFAVCTIWALVRTTKRTRRRLAVALAVLAVVCAVTAVVFREKFARLFRSLLEAGLVSQTRLEIFRACWNTFLAHPFTGVGFYATPGFAFGSVGNFLPPRAHNTYLQLLATGGIMLVAAYLFHRVQTLRLLFFGRTPEKMFVFFSVLALLLTSLLDCHFFNVGPPILYGILLCYAEIASPSRVKQR